MLQIKLLVITLWVACQVWIISIGIRLIKKDTFAVNKYAVQLIYLVFALTTLYVLYTFWDNKILLLIVTLPTLPFHYRLIAFVMGIWVADYRSKQVSRKESRKRHNDQDW